LESKNGSKDPCLRAHGNGVLLASLSFGCRNGYRVHGLYGQRSRWRKLYQEASACALTLSSFWITIPISLAMFGYLAYVLRKPKPLAPLSPDYISLRDAAATLYGECRARKSKWIIGAEALSGHGISRGNHEDIFDWMAGIIEVKKPIYGMRLPSNIREKISKDDINHAVFTKGATQLEHFLPGKGILYTNLEMKASDLDDLIQEMSFEAVDQE